MEGILTALLETYGQRNTSGIVFSLREMGCEDSLNYYLSPSPAHRAPVTLTCTWKGDLFREKHTKIFIRPEFCSYLRSPHTEPNAIKGHFLSPASRSRGYYSSEVFGGMFLHYNRMKYSRNEANPKSKNKRKKSINKRVKDEDLVMKSFVQEMLAAIEPRHH